MTLETDLHKALEKKIESELKRTASRPNALEFRLAADGAVSLGGVCFDSELSGLAAAIRKIEGVTSVEHAVDLMQDTPQATPGSFQSTFKYRQEMLEGEGGASYRWGIGLMSFLLLYRGFRSEKKWGGALMALGLMGLFRAVSRLDLTQWLGGVILPVLDLNQEVEVGAAAEEVFDFWGDFSNYSRFMSYIEKVQVTDQGFLRWTSVGPGGLELSWDTELTRLVPGQEVAWKSVPGSLIVTEGAVRITAIGPTRSKAHVTLRYAPPAGALGYAALRRFGFDLSSRFQEDLRLMRMLVERQSRMLRRIRSSDFDREQEDQKRSA